MMKLVVAVARFTWWRRERKEKWREAGGRGKRDGGRGNRDGGREMRGGRGREG